MARRFYAMTPCGDSSTARRRLFVRGSIFASSVGMPGIAFTLARTASCPRLVHSLAPALVIALTLCCANAARAAEQAPASKGSSAQSAAPAQSAPPAPAAVPLPELSAQAEAATIDVREIAAHAAADQRVVAIEQGLPALASDIDRRARENARIVSHKPSLDLLRTLERPWQRQRQDLAASTAQLDQRVAALDRDLARVEQLQTTWKETRALAVKESAPAELVQRVEALLAAIDQTQRSVEAKRAQTLRVQSRVAAQDFKVTEALEAIRQARNVTLGRVLQRDSPPLWNLELLTRASATIAEDSQETASVQTAALRDYLAARWDRLFLHAFVVGLLAILLGRARRRIKAWCATERGLDRVEAVFAMPVATALVLSFMASRWIYPEAPRLMWAIVGAVALIPTVIVLRPLVARYLVPVLYAIVAFYFVDQVRTITASVDLLPRLVFFVEMIAGAVFLGWFLRSFRRNGGMQHPRLRAFIGFGLRVGCTFFAATAAANTLGYVALANLLGGAALRSLYLGILLYTFVQILDALVLILLRVWPLAMLGMARKHHDLLRRRARFALYAGAFVLWLLFVLERLAVREAVVRGLHGALTAEATLGAISISAGDVLAFVLAVWASFLVSRFVRFILDEEVFPHARLKRGLPYAISRTAHYLILVGGFFVAMAALGLDMTKFTILAGAFTVGVGFGLQNIFNNFVSGLILLFERPVQVGDLVQMDDATGIVQRIGIRASIVRASNGSEIIVPNGKLISDRLVNWTLSERQRGVEVSISVVLGSDPARVISTLERVASAHPRVLKTPPPQALLTRLGPDWMGFELRAATDHVEEWMEVRSELGVAAAAALAAEDIKLR